MKSEYSEGSRSTPRLLMSWILASPGHQQPLCWLCLKNRSFHYDKFQMIVSSHFWEMTEINRKQFLCKFSMARVKSYGIVSMRQTDISYARHPPAMMTNRTNIICRHWFSWWTGTHKIPAIIRINVNWYYPTEQKLNIFIHKIKTQHAISF